eukprot:TRINITY_DN13653_c0_g2_i1.p1 TRINITY_DN13653_c0_g2~~TRINITY_DN13653_c0_g2_i1.p1  ORF type:complete len:228 (+),score=17.49 TRINITY_DN13653_c0_g2_i1:112-795(+)
MYRGILAWALVLTCCGSSSGSPSDGSLYIKYKYECPVGFNHIEGTGADKAASGKKQCEQGAAYLGLPDVTSSDSNSTSGIKGCRVSNGKLYFEEFGFPETDDTDVIFICKRSDWDSLQIPAPVAFKCADTDSSVPVLLMAALLTYTILVLPFVVYWITNMGRDRSNYADDGLQKATSSVDGSSNASPRTDTTAPNLSFAPMLTVTSHHDTYADLPTKVYPASNMKRP